jgi:hypothetical protein
MSQVSAVHENCYKPILGLMAKKDKDNMNIPVRLI